MTALLKRFSVNELKSLIQQRFDQKIFIILGTILFLFLCGYLFLTRHHISTDDAYVNADVIPISPQVSGQVKRVYVENNEGVAEGDPLFDIDPTPFQIAVEKAKAELSLAMQNEAQLEAAVAAASAQVVIREAELQNAKATADRKISLVKAKQLPAQEGDDAIAAMKTAKASLDLAKANLQEAKMNLGIAGEENEQIHIAKSNLRVAELNLSYTHVTAPARGYIANMTLQSGAVVEANAPLFALISKAYFWVDANFKETEIRHIRPGQKAEVSIDMYSGKKFEGVVDSISDGSGNAFSLLPAQNATGNWVKVTQRVPVKVRLINLDEQYPLRIGTSASVTIFAEKIPVSESK